MNSKNTYSLKNDANNQLSSSLQQTADQILMSKYDLISSNVTKVDLMMLDGNYTNRF